MNKLYCIWTQEDHGMMGFHDYEYGTSCGKQFDCDKLYPSNIKFCPNCGNPIKKLTYEQKKIFLNGLGNPNIFVYGMSGSGKDTITNFLRDYYGYAKLRIARTIKYLITEEHDITFDQLEERKRDEPDLRFAHNHWGTELQNRNRSTDNRAKQLADGRSMDFEYIDINLPRAICDVRTESEARIFLENGFTGIFLSRVASEARLKSHFTEQCMFSNGTVEKLFRDYPDLVKVFHNSSNDIENQQNLISGMLNMATNGTKKALIDAVNLTIFNKNNTI